MAPEQGEISRLLLLSKKVQRFFARFLGQKNSRRKEYLQMGGTDIFYEVRPDCDDVPKTRFKPKIGKTLSERKWRSVFSEEGYLDIAKVLSRIQRGGVHPSIRGEVWEFLVGCFDPKSTFVERDAIRAQRREQYAKVKAECQALDASVGSGHFSTTPKISPDGTFVENPHMSSTNTEIKAADDTEVENAYQANGYFSKKDLSESHHAVESCKITDKDVIQWMLILHQIGLDVVRTDRTLKFYEIQENLAKLWDILAVYAWMDKDIGYCQGMSDLCSPMVILYENEADAFWCFERLMRRLRGNFRCTEESVGVQTQLRGLASVIQVLDPALHQHLEALGGGSYIFAFRMLMVLFRREFSFGDSLFLWEMMWALEYDPETIASYQEELNGRQRKENLKYKSKKQWGKFERANLKSGFRGSAEMPFAVFLAASVLEAKSSLLLNKTQGIDDVVKILNDLTGSLDAKKACAGALKLQKKYLRKAKKKVQ